MLFVGSCVDLPAHAPPPPLAGYQLLTFAFFLLAFPLNVAIKTWASCATILLCRRAQQQPGEAPGGWARRRWPGWRFALCPL